MERTVFRFVILLLVWLALSPAAVAQIPCDQYLAPMFASPHFLPTPDSTVGRYNAIASRDGFFYALNRGTLNFA